MKAFLALLKIDLKLAARNRSVLFFNLLLPLIFFFVFAQAFDAKQGSIILLVVAMVMVIGILSNGLLGAGMRAVQEREENILRRYKVTPITPVPLLAASMVTGVVVYLPSVIILLLLNLLSLLVFICIGTLAFRALGLIVAAVVNTSQEAQILTNLIYMPMLFLSGATIPLSVFPNWLQIATQFIPATYLMSGIAGILQHGETLGQNWKSVLALLVAAAVGLFIATKIFRWEKEEKLRPSAKMWVVAVLLPFFLLGAYQAWSRQELTKSKVLAREQRRGRTWLVQNARIFVGNGKVIENGGVLIKSGKIAEVYEDASPEATSINAEKIDAAVAIEIVQADERRARARVAIGRDGLCAEKIRAVHEPRAQRRVRAVEPKNIRLNFVRNLGAARNSVPNFSFVGHFSRPKAVMEPSMPNTCPNRCGQGFWRSSSASRNHKMKHARR